MVKPEQSQTADRPRELSGTQTLSGRSPGCVSGPSLCTRGAQTSNCFCGLEHGLSGNEDSQHFDCATWLHEARELPKERLLCILPCHGSACLARLWFPVSFRSKRRKRSTWRELTGKVLGRNFDANAVTTVLAFHRGECPSENQRSAGRANRGKRGHRLCAKTKT